MFKTEYIYLEEIDSTITYAKKILNDKNYILDKNIIIIAETQTKGYGKFNRKWVSPKGNLYLTAIFKPFEGYSWSNFNNINIFNLLVSFSLLQSMISILNGSSEYSIFCKWPNDIIINEAKVSGILLENISKQGMELLLVSVGANLVVAPEVNNNYKVTSLKDINNIDITPNEFGTLLINNIYENIKTLSKEKVIYNWLQYAYRLKKVINLKMGTIIKSGIFEGLNSDGLLLLKIDKDNIETISVGEIY